MGEPTPTPRDAVAGAECLHRGNGAAESCSGRNLRHPECALAALDSNGQVVVPRDVVEQVAEALRAAKGFYAPNTTYAAHAAALDALRSYCVCTSSTAPATAARPRVQPNGTPPPSPIGIR